MMLVLLLKSADLKNMYHCQKPKHVLTNFITSWRHGLVHHITSLWLMELRPLWSSREHHPGDRDRWLFLVMTWLKVCSPYWGWVKHTHSHRCHYNTVPSLFFGVPTSQKLLQTRPIFCDPLVPEFSRWHCVYVHLYVCVCTYLKLLLGTEM